MLKLSDYLGLRKKKVKDIVNQLVRGDLNSLSTSEAFLKSMLKWPAWALTGSSPSSLSHVGVSSLVRKEKSGLMFRVPHRFPEALMPHLRLGTTLRRQWALSFFSGVLYLKSALAGLPYTHSLE